jgi:hypothetical protein
MAWWASLLLLASVLVLELLSSGILFGWGALRLILEREGFYKDQCDANAAVNVSCEDRDNTFGLVYTLATTALVFTSGPAGVLVDKAGPAVSYALAGFLVATGLAAVGLANPDNGPDLLLPGLMMMGSGGMMAFMSSFSISFLFPVWQAMIITASNVFFDASSVLFLLFEHLNRTGVERRELFVTFAAVLAFFFALTAILWIFHRKQLQAVQEETRNADTDGEQEGSKGSECSADEEEGLRRIQRTKQQIQDDFKRKGALQQMRSAHFALSMVFGCVHILKSNTYLGMNKQLLERLGDGDAPGSRENGHLYTTMFVASLPLSSFSIPVIGWMLDKLPFTSPSLCEMSTFDVVNNLGILHSLLTLVPVLEVQLLSFLVFTFYRAFFFSLISTFNANTFGVNTIGTIQGTVYSTAGIVNLLQYPLLMATNDPGLGDGDFSYLNAAFAILCVLLSFLIRWHAIAEQAQYPDLPAAKASAGPGGAGDAAKPLPFSAAEGALEGPGQGHG